MNVLFQYFTDSKDFYIGFAGYIANATRTENEFIIVF